MRVLYHPAAPVTPTLYTVIYEIYKLTLTSEGEVNADNTSAQSITISNIPYGTSLTASVTTYGDTDFRYWATQGLNAIQYSAILNHIVVSDMHYYAVISTPTSSSYYYKIYCDYGSIDNVNNICMTCDDLVTIYFNLAEYQLYGELGSVWYLNSTLTTIAPDGYYRTSNEFGNQIYIISNGIPSLIGNCGLTIDCQVAP